MASASSTPKGVSIIIAPFHTGDRLRRVSRGPHRILKTGLVDALSSTGIEAIGLVGIERVDNFEGEIGRMFEVKRRIATAVRMQWQTIAFCWLLQVNATPPLVCTQASMQTWTSSRFDAHPDFDTPDNCSSGYSDGQGVATLVGQCWRRLTYTISEFYPLSLNRLIYCGIRDFEPGHREKVEVLNVRAVYGGADHGGHYAQELCNSLNDQYRGGLAHVHLDLDMLETSVRIGNEYATAGGLDVDQLHSCLVEVVRARQPVSMTIASLNPDGQGIVAIANAAIAITKLVVPAAFGISEYTSSNTVYQLPFFIRCFYAACALTLLMTSLRLRGLPL